MSIVEILYYGSAGLGLLAGVVIVTSLLVSIVRDFWKDKQTRPYALFLFLFYTLLFTSVIAKVIKDIS